MMHVHGMNQMTRTTARAAAREAVRQANAQGFAPAAANATASRTEVEDLVSLFKDRHNPRTARAALALARRTGGQLSRAAASAKAALMPVARETVARLVMAEDRPTGGEASR